MRTIRIVIFIIVGLLIALPAFGQVQRMALRAGSFEIGAGASVVREAFCLNAGRAAPEIGKALTQVLTPAEHAMVRFGSEPPISLTGLY